MLPKNGDRGPAQVTKRLKGPDGRPIGLANVNPLLDTRQHEAEFSDGMTQDCFANVIAENLFSQVDEEGRQQLVLQEISDHRKDGSAIPISEGMFRTRSGAQVPKKTTRGWELKVEWKDGTSDWVPLRELKESNPIELAEFAVANKIDHEPALCGGSHMS